MPEILVVPWWQDPWRLLLGVWKRMPISIRNPVFSGWILVKYWTNLDKFRRIFYVWCLMGKGMFRKPEAIWRPSKCFISWRVVSDRWFLLVTRHLAAVARDVRSNRRGCRFRAGKRKMSEWTSLEDLVSRPTSRLVQLTVWANGINSKARHNSSCRNASWQRKTGLYYGMQ